MPFEERKVEGSRKYRRGELQRREADGKKPSLN